MNVNINIVTTQFNELGEENVIKSNVDGTLYQKKDHKYIIYKEKKMNILRSSMQIAGTPFFVFASFPFTGRCLPPLY